MNLQRLPEYLVRWVTTIVGLIFALYVARQTASGQMGTVIGFFAVIAATGILLAAKDKIWVFIPITWSLTGQIPGLGLPFAVRDLAVLFVFVAFLTLKALKIVRMKPRTGLLDVFAYLILFYLVLSFFRNPVGVDALGSERVGGRPYVTCFIGFLAYWVLCRTQLNAKSTNRFTAGIMSGGMIDGMLTQLAVWAPFLGIVFASIYAGGYVSIANQDSGAAIALEEKGRLTYLGAIGSPIVGYLVSRYPFRSLFSIAQPWRPLLLAFGFYCILLSGFRSALIGALCFTALAAYIHRGKSEIIRMGLIGVFGLLVLGMGNGVLFNLPFSVQRTLTWLPGNWDYDAVSEARGSTEWRTAMWREMLTTDRYINDKILGDGFGMTRQQFYLTTLNTIYNGNDPLAAQENFMINGDVHSGPVSAIRNGGYVGLAIIMIGLILLSREAWRFIRRAYPSPYRVLTILLCVNMVLEPFYFVFVFGAYSSNITEFFFRLGLLRMLQNSLEAYEDRKSENDVTSIEVPRVTLPKRPRLQSALPVS